MLLELISDQKVALSLSFTVATGAFGALPKIHCRKSISSR